MVRCGTRMPALEREELSLRREVVRIGRGVPIEANGSQSRVTVGFGLDKKIDLRGFGTFSVRESAARTGRNPQTGEPIQIPARRVPTFKPGKELKEKVNKEPLVLQQP